MRTTRLQRLLTCLLATLAMGGCAMTSHSQISASDGTPQHAFHRVAVIAMSTSKDERQVFDDALVARLTAAGIEGIVGDRYIEDAAAANGVAPMEALRAARADGVIYVWMRPDDASVRTDAVAAVPGWGGTGMWYLPARSAAASHFEARLYDIDTQALAWTGTTTTFYPKSLALDAPSIADALVGALEKSKFVVRGR